jgi:hypothetical protein
LTSVTAAIVVSSLDVFISSWHFPFQLPRHARGLLTDAIIPLSVAVAKPMPGGKLPHNGALPWSPYRRRALHCDDLIDRLADRIGFSPCASPVAPDNRN